MSVARAIVAAHAGRSPMRLVYAATAGQSPRSTCAGAMLGRPEQRLMRHTGRALHTASGSTRVHQAIAPYAAAAWTRMHCESTHSPGVQAPRAAAARAAGGSGTWGTKTLKKSRCEASAASAALTASPIRKVRPASLPSSTLSIASSGAPCLSLLNKASACPGARHARWLPTPGGARTRALTGGGDRCGAGGRAGRGTAPVHPGGRQRQVRLTRQARRPAALLQSWQPQPLVACLQTLLSAVRNSDTRREYSWAAAGQEGGCSPATCTQRRPNLRPTPGPRASAPSCHTSP